MSPTRPGQQSLTDTLWLTVVESSAVGGCPWNGSVREGSRRVQGVSVSRPD